MSDLRHLLEKTVCNVPLSEGELGSVFEAILSGQLNDSQIAAFLSAWRMAGESTQLLTVGARYLRTHALKPPIADSLRPLCDNCGTGGSGLPKFNISTAAAIVAAACGVRIAKHGNRSVSSKCGSADLLFEAGFPTKLDESKATELLSQTNLTFFFAPNFHPVVAHVMPVRKNLGIKTVFNLLGPLANPLAPEVQLLGVGHKSHMLPMAEALQALGVKKALVVHSQDGLDEISPAAPTWALLIDHESIAEFPIDPSKYGVKATLAGLHGQDAAYNLRILHQVLKGEPIEAAEGVIINTAALLWLSGAEDSLDSGIKRARQKLLSREAWTFFQDWIGLANG